MEMYEEFDNLNVDQVNMFEKEENTNLVPESP